MFSKLWTAVEEAGMAKTESQMEDDLTRMWGNFSLSEVECAELEIQDQTWEIGVHQGKNCVVGKLIADHLVSKEIIRNTLLRGWKPSGTPSFKVLGDNLFLVDFVTGRDKQRVLEGRPWVFEGSLFAIEDFDGLTPPSKYLFDKAAFWVRMYNLPLACMSMVVGQQIGSSMGNVDEVDVDEGGMGWGESLRVKITLDLHKPLSRGRKLKINGASMLIGFQYERLPKFCFDCGVIKHGATGCAVRRGARKQNATTEFGPWMRASSPKRSFGGRLGHREDRRESPQRDNGRGRYDHGRRQTPGRKRPPSRNQEEEEKSSGTAEHHTDSPLESHLRGHSFPCRGKPSVSKSGEDPANVDLRSENHGGLTSRNLGEQSGRTEAGMEESNNSGYNAASNKESVGNSNGENINAFLDELAHMQGVREKAKISSKLESDAGNKKDGGNFFTMADVEKKMKDTLRGQKIEMRRASDNSWARSSKEIQVSKNAKSGGEIPGKRKTRDFNEGVDEVVKKGCVKGGRCSKSSGGAPREENIGSGMADAAKQLRRPQ